ncbi:hypothetical protein SNE25_19260 [Mucilaginibacter sabulilitoris]|uniref:Alpha-L-rhamnosidase six-hairpin glycosidase domain-containing protein n=1 Tax=Mucilaginibacter sabulilitoris TaxID=1173583 RepID=A0ABZ0TIR0_9SPHI|nr:hypothetical protein [Mucilaginibacter sabulilitoris]WPU91460.1 hypothetical protein SNE25_19260 [Mucilaginibacter sabulilitoris]
MKIPTTIKSIVWLCILLIASFANGFAKGKEVYFYGSEKNDLYQLLKREGYSIRKYNTPQATITAATRGAGVFIIASDYPKLDPVNQISTQLLSQANKKGLKLYVEYPSSFPGLNIPSKPVETHLERAVVTGNVFGSALKPMDLLAIQNSYILPVEVSNPLIVLAKVVGFDKAEYGLKDTKAYPLLFEQGGALVSMTGLSNFETGRYGPQQSIKTVWKYILSRITGNEAVHLDKWIEDVRPMYDRNTPLPATARLNSIKKGAQWYNNGRFFIDPSWKADWLKYGADGLKPVGPPVSQAKPSGDGSLGVLEGHTSTIYYDGSQQYRYWMRADVQGEVSMAMAAAGRLLNNKEYESKSANLVDYMFRTSNLRAGAKNDPNSAAFGLLGWATTNAGTFYGDDNSRAILGAMATASYLHTDKWDKELAEAILGNFRTTSKQGFRGERLEEADIIKNGWQYYYNRDLVHESPHFESWMWACYLWLYSKTGYAPLLERTKTAIKTTMEGYPDQWKWGSSMQTQRARMILPLAWLVRVENTEEHRQWLDKMVNEILKYQDASGAIQEELGKGKGMFKALNTNADYGSDEGSLIFRNGEKAACMLYTCNFALFSLNEAAQATGNKKYKDAVNKLSDFLTRIQVQSKKHNDLDGAWMRGFDYGRWDYWASNSDAGWGTWCTLTGWIQSWIVTTQIQIQQNESYWDVTKNSAIQAKAKPAIDQMLKQ